MDPVSRRRRHDHRRSRIGARGDDAQRSRCSGCLLARRSALSRRQHENLGPALRAESALRAQLHPSLHVAVLALAGRARLSLRPAIRDHAGLGLLPADRATHAFPLRAARHVPMECRCGDVGRRWGCEPGRRALCALSGSDLREMGISARRAHRSSGRRAAGSQRDGQPRRGRSRARALPRSSRGEPERSVGPERARDAEARRRCAGRGARSAGARGRRSPVRSELRLQSRFGLPRARRPPASAPLLQPRACAGAQFRTGAQARRRARCRGRVTDAACHDSTMNKRNAFYAQSGGVTAVINASAAAVIETARKHRTKIGNVYAGRNGIIGALTEDLIDTNRESARAIAALSHTPGGAFASARYKLKGLDQSRAQYERLIEVFRAHDIGYFFYNGGNDSADTCLKVSQIASTLGYPLIAVHIPKTVDNAPPLTDNCPGFGSVAKYVATSMREAAFDVASMAKTSTRVFVLEVMGRNAGWITAAVGMADDRDTPVPLVLLFPEIAFDQDKFLAAVDTNVKRFGYCCVGVSGGLKDPGGSLMGEGGRKDPFVQSPLGGVGPMIAG